ncbi:hypothetical protein LZL87_006723 [Fusarium oxysporum]|nr:hypothetical protein LZL87_006723 [Fusarium oxysporum]
MSESRYHEGLEVYSDSAAHAPEVSPYGVYNQGSKDPISGYVQDVEARKGPFGLSTLSLCALVAIVTAVVVGAGVGGGVGSALANCKTSKVSEASPVSAIQTSSCPTLTTSASDTTETTESKFYEPKPADQVANLTLPDACSKPNGKDDYTTTNGYVFTYTCGFDYPGNDIVPILAYTAFDSAQPQKHRSFALFEPRAKTGSYTLNIYNLQHTTMYELEKYWIAHGAMVFLGAWIPSVILFFCSFCLVRRKRDPARTAFTYLKLALLVFSGYAFFEFASYVVSVVHSQLYYSGRIDSDFDSHYSKTLLVTVQVLATLALIYDMVTDILVMIILLRLGTGIVMVQTGRPDPKGKILRLVSYIAAAILFILALTAFGLRIRYVYEVFFNDVRVGADSFTKSRQIGFSFSVLVFVISLAIVARAIMIKVQSKGENALTWCSNMFIAASVVWLMRTTFNMASTAAWTNLSSAFRDREYKYAYYILEVVFGIWPQLVVLCLVFAIGRARNNGIWSKQEQEQEPVKGVEAGERTAWGYGQVAPQPQNAVPMPQQQHYPQPEQRHMDQGYGPQQQVPQQQNGYYAPQQPQYAAYDAISPVSQPRSPPPHEETVGLNHQADGTPPQVPAQPYPEKH